MTAPDPRRKSRNAPTHALFAPRRATAPMVRRASGWSIRSCTVSLSGTKGVIVGYLLGQRHVTFHAGGPVLWIEEVMVAEHRRGTGVGGALMQAVEDRAEARGAAYVALATSGPPTSMCHSATRNPPPTSRRLGL